MTQYLDDFRIAKPQNISMLVFDLAEQEPGYLNIFYDCDKNIFVMDFRCDLPSYSTEDKQYHRTNYARHLKQKEWLSQVKSYFSTIIQDANNKLKSGEFLAENFVFLASYKKNSETNVRTYKLTYEIIEKKKNKQANLVLTDEHIIYFDTKTEQYITKQLGRVSDDVKNKIAELIEYMQSNAGNDIYIQNLMKGNFTSMGDPEV